MNNEYLQYISDQVFDFFQYPEYYDKTMIDTALQKLDCSGKKIIFNGMELKTDFVCNKENALGFFLANIPLMFSTLDNKKYELPQKLKKLRLDTEELIKLEKFNEVATLDLYLLLEMAMRCAYSKWLGNRIAISKIGMKDIVLTGYDYRKLKLYIRLNRLGRTDINVNGEPFPGSENSLLTWATKFVDRPTGLALRLSLNVRNLLAHGENEWSLFPVLESVAIASDIAGKLLLEIRPGMQIISHKNFKSSTGRNINERYKTFRGNRH
ncbi:hypothetical protein [Ferroplasma sp.]|uniref:hypothetical protein n=1 Tax=Ferroplasma sp. TaxID=2591003 RepID=UPI00307DCC68